MFRRGLHRLQVKGLHSVPFQYVWIISIMEKVPCLIRKIVSYLFIYLQFIKRRCQLLRPCTSVDNKFEIM